MLYDKIVLSATETVHSDVIACYSHAMYKVHVCTHTYTLSIYHDTAKTAFDRKVLIV